MMILQLSTMNNITALAIVNLCYIVIVNYFLLVLLARSDLKVKIVHSQAKLVPRRANSNHKNSLSRGRTVDELSSQSFMTSLHLKGCQVGCFCDTYMLGHARNYRQFFVAGIGQVNSYGPIYTWYVTIIAHWYYFQYKYDDLANFYIGLFESTGVVCCLLFNKNFHDFSGPHFSLCSCTDIRDFLHILNFICVKLFLFFMNFLHTMNDIKKNKEA